MVFSLALGLAFLDFAVNLSQGVKPAGFNGVSVSWAMVGLRLAFLL